jgi:hypothetical protein
MYFTRHIQGYTYFNKYLYILHLKGTHSNKDNRRAKAFSELLTRASNYDDHLKKLLLQTSQIYEPVGVQKSSI